MIMRGEQRFRADLIVQIFHDRPRETESIEGARAAANFVEDNQAVRRRVVQNVRGLTHFHHESGLSAGQVITRANA